MGLTEEVDAMGVAFCFRPTPVPVPSDAGPSLVPTKRASVSVPPRTSSNPVGEPPRELQAVLAAFALLLDTIDGGGDGRSARCENMQSQRVQLGYSGHYTF